MVRVTVLLVLGVVLMGLGVAYLVIGWVYGLLGLAIFAFLPFIIGFAIVLSEVNIERHKNKGDGNKQ